MTNEDIEHAAEVLNIASGFDAQRVDVIKCMESRDIVACPGSGKTTVLLAKLIILARQLPLKNNKGICIITHTNVAIDEIKKRLGDKASALLSYPNFVGTIQSFIDKYLAVPASIKFYGRRPVTIDTDKFNIQIEKMFDFINMRNGLEAFCNRNKTSIADLRFSLEDKLIYKGQKLFLFDKEVDKKYETKLIRAFNTLITERGILRYEIAMELALKYLEQYENELRTLFTERFAYAFVDEMQDTNDKQMQILTRIFDRDQTIFQCFGDPQQAIYNSIENNGAWIPNKPYYITNSKRFSHNIATVSDLVSIAPYGMRGKEASNIPPIIITYKDNNVESVLQIFSELIKKYSLQNEKNAVFKAIGMVKGKDKLGIRDYYPSFDKNNDFRNYKNDYLNIESYFSKLDDVILSKNGIKAYYDRFLNVILKVMRFANIKTNEGRYYSKNAFLNHVSETDQQFFDRMHRIFVKFITLIEKEKEIKKYFSQLILIIIRRYYSVNVDLKEIFHSKTSIDKQVDSAKSLKNNIYKNKEIEIQIDTVHGVKGQTHTATLYLETMYYEKTVENIIDYLVNNSKRKRGKRIEKHLKIAYVAMTRPEKLLCITMDESIFKQNEYKLKVQGWVSYVDILKEENEKNILDTNLTQCLF